MGYIVGRNSAPSAIEARNVQPAKPIVVEPPARNPNKDTDQPPPIEPAPQPAPEKANAERPAPPPPVAEKPAPEKKTPVKPQPSVTPAPENPPAPASSASVEQPPPGRYWQVVSTGRHEAEIVSSAIAKKGMKSIVAPAPKEGYFRVLVGPLGDSAETAKIRGDLEAAGFKPILAHY